jgi:hypothetical protein
MSTEKPAAMRPQNSKEESVANMEYSIDGTAQAGGWQSGLKVQDDFSEAAWEHRPDELGKSSVEWTPHSPQSLR